MAEPFLDFGDVGFVREGVGGGGGAERMDAKAVDLGADAGFEAVLAQNVSIYGSGVEGAVELLGSAVITDRAEEGAG